MHKARSQDSSYPRKEGSDCKVVNRGLLGCINAPFLYLAD